MRLKIVFAIFNLFWIILIVRIYYISIKSNAYYEELAQSNAIKVDELAPFRGFILDRKGKPLSVNKVGFSIGIKPQLRFSKNIKKLDTEIKFLVQMFPQLEFAKLKKTYLKRDSSYYHDFVKVVDFIAYADIIKHFTKISQRDNLKIKIASKRFYPYKKLASHVIGYVAKANVNDEKNNDIAKLVGFVGKTGIEKYYNDVLEGQKGTKVTKVTAFNEEIAIIDKKLPTSNNVKLTIDLELQDFISKLFKDQAGAVIVMDVTNGQILSAGSFPEYDLNQFVSGISQKEWNILSNDFNHPFTNKLINGLYPPGSIVKMGVGLAFLQSKLITPYTKFFDEGFIELGGRKFRCWKKRGHGIVNLTKAIRESCDVYFYKGSLKVGIDRISPVMKQLGFGKKTEIDLPREFSGTVPSRKWKMQRYQKPWYQGETLITAIGQGFFLATPMQVAKYTALLATGYSITPHFIDGAKGIHVEYGKKDILSNSEKKDLKIIRKAMREVVANPHGTAFRYIKSKVQLAAKTGTAQVVGIPQGEKKRMKEYQLEYFKRSHAWLTAFGPYKNPQYVVTVLVEHGGHGGHAAGTIVSKIYNKLLKMGYIKE